MTSPTDGRQRSSAQDLERYGALFSSRTRGMKSSVMRQIMALTARSEVISLAGGLPDTSTFPAEDLAALMSRVAADSAARALQYGPTSGLPDVFQSIVRVMAAEGTQVDPDDVMITTGGQQVIDLMCKVLVDPGDVIVAEAPTYPGAVPTFSAYQADVVQVEMDGDGLRIDALEETLAELDRQGRRPKFVYTVPNFHNPGGVTMAAERRQRLVAIARERELLILEDNPYGLLRYEGEPLPTLYSLDAGIAGRGGASEHVVYLGTFSKILSPGLRLGWAVAPRPILDKLGQGKQGSDLCSPSISQLFVAAYFAQGERWRAYVDELSALYRGRRDVMLDALAEHLGPQATWTRPAGGMFIWATLPPEIDTTDLLVRAIEERVAFVPGQGCYVDGRGGSSMRLNFSGVTEGDIREGVRRIGQVVGEQMDLYGTLTGAPRRTRSLPSAPPVRSAADPPAGADVVPLPRRSAGRRR